MHGCCTVQGGTAIAVMYLVNILVEKRVVEEAMWIIADCFVVHEQTRDGQQKIYPAIFVDISVKCVLSYNIR